MNLMYFFNDTIRNPVLSFLMPAFDYDEIWRLPLAAAWLGVMIFGTRRVRIVGLFTLWLLLITDPLSSQMLKPLFERIRPCNILPGLHMWKDGAWIVLPDPVVEVYRSSFSMPSSHAANTGAQALWWGWAYPRARWYCGGCAFIIGFSRIYDGLHWPSDIFIGWIVSGLCFGIIWFVGARFVNVRYKPLITQTKSAKSV